MKQQLTLDNKEQESILNGLLYEIQQSFLENEDEIIQELNKIIANLDDKDKGQAIQYINQEFQNYSFIEKGNFKLQDYKIDYQDHLKSYSVAIQNKDYKKLHDLINNPIFCQVNHIPTSFVQIISNLQKKDELIIDIIQIIEDSRNKTSISQYQLMLSLIKILYNKNISPNDQQKLEALIGSSLQKQIYQIYCYLNKICINQKTKYVELITNFQKQWLQIDKIGDQQLQTEKNFKNELALLDQIYTFDLERSKDSINQYILAFFNIENQHLNAEWISDQLCLLILRNENIEELYFMIIFYFWSQHCKQVQFLNQYNTIKSHIKNINLERRQIFLKKQAEKCIAENRNDQIQIFFVQFFIYFNPDLEEQQFGTLATFSKANNEIIQQICSLNLNTVNSIISLSLNQLVELGIKIKILQYYELNEQFQQGKLVKLFFLLFWTEEIDQHVYLGLQQMFQKQNASFQTRINQIAIVHLKTLYQVKKNYQKSVSTLRLKKYQLSLALKYFDCIPNKIQILQDYYFEFYSRNVEEKINNKKNYYHNYY